MNISENIKLGLRAIIANKLRTILTICIIALGLMALLGILTCIEAIKSSVNSNFATLGANSFSIRNFDAITSDDEDNSQRPDITKNQADEFKRKYNYTGVVSISYVPFNEGGIVKYESVETNPNVTVMAVDENFISVGGYSLMN